MYGKDESDGRYLQIANKLSEITRIQGPKSFDSAIDLNENPIKSSGNNALEFDGMGNVTVPGNLEILGETLSANVENLDVDDPIIKLADGNMTNALDIGLLGQRSGPNVFWGWDESADEIVAAYTDSDAETGNVNINSYANFRAGDATLGELLIKEGITLDELATFFQSQTFAGGFVGEGFQLKKDEQGKWMLTVDDLVIRNSAKIYELLVTQLQAFAEFLLTEGHKVEDVKQVGAGFDWGQSENPFNSDYLYLNSGVNLIGEEGYQTIENPENDIGGSVHFYYRHEDLSSFGLSVGEKITFSTEVWRSAGSDQEGGFYIEFEDENRDRIKIVYGGFGHTEDNVWNRTPNRTITIPQGADKISVALDDRNSATTGLLKFRNSLLVKGSTIDLKEESPPPYTWADQYKCFIPEDKLLQLATDDLLLRQDFDGRNVGSNETTVIDTEQGSIVPTENDPRRSFTVYLEDVDAVPLEGWQFARSGNRTNPDRQGGIYFVGTGADAPYQRFYNGVDRHRKFGKMETIRGQQGNLDNLVVPWFDDLDGTQNNLDGTYWNGNHYVNDGHYRGVIEVTGGNAETTDGATGKANQALKDAKEYTDNKVTSQGGNAILRSDGPPNARTDGSSLQLGDLWVETDNNDKPYTWNGDEWKPAYTVIQGNQISTPNLAAITTKTGVLTVDEKITVGDGSNDGIIESFNYDANSGFRLQEADGKLIANNADVRGKITAEAGSITGDLGVTGILTIGGNGKIESSNFGSNSGFSFRADNGKLIARNADLSGSFTADGDVSFGGALSYDESSGVVTLGGNSSEGGVRLEIDGYTSLPGGGYMNTDGLIYSSDKHIGFGSPGTSALDIDAGMYTSGDDLHLSAFGSSFSGTDINQNITFDHKRVDKPQLESYSSSGIKPLTVKSSFVVITNAPSGTDIGSIRNFPNETPENGQVVDVLNSTNSDITIRDASGVSGGNITGQGGANREIFPDTFARFRYYTSRWHLMSEFS